MSMTAAQINRAASNSRNCPVQWDETFIDELMLTLCQRISKLPRLAREAKAAECIAKIERAAKRE